MLSSVRKNVVRSLCAFPLTVGFGFAQSPAGLVTGVGIGIYSILNTDQ